MVQLSVMAMILGAVVLMALPVPRHRIAGIVSRGFGMGVLAAGLVGLAYVLAAPVV